MKNYALIGYPLGHSLSPQIHTRLLQLSGVEGGYEKLEIPPEELTNSFEKLANLSGFNITIPHKVAIMDYCDRLDEGAKRYRSVNCVKNGEEKVGYNTDVLGFTKSIEMLGASLSGKVLLIGCGGVGRMMAIETALSGGELTIAALKSDRELAERVMAEIAAMKPEAKVNAVYIDGALSPDNFGGEMPRFDLLINASPVGMYPKTDRMACTPEVLEKVSFVFDAVYNPKVTLLAKTAREKGAKAMTGMAMLVLQAAAAHEIWNKAHFNDSDLKKLISDMEELV
ncbi:MAG: shikimate dehydrogenase family protein [Ruminiclostridium sp.]